MKRACHEYYEDDHSEGDLRKILLYGGCHALVLRDYLNAVFGDRFDCALIVNFELIASRAPFPYASLAAYDAVLFSPIENTAGYETNELVAACKRHGIPAIGFPWLEWHGYFPGAVKGRFRGHFRWHYPELLDRAAVHHGSLDDFCEAVIDGFPDDAAIDAASELSMAHVRAAEVRNDIAPVLSTAIARDFREHRLFLVPDHPGRRLYIELLGSLLPRLGVEVEEAQARFLAPPPIEPQWRWRMPIFPRVARRLALAFADTGWVDDDIHPGLLLGLRDYLAQYLGAPGERSGDAHRSTRDLSGARELMRAW